ncbi:MAG: type II secretion system F family protein [Candidatus Aminicenantes bacterium]
MPLFKWKGKNRYGDMVEGERTSPSEAVLRADLQRDQISILDIKRARREIKIPFLESRKVKTKDLAVFSRQLSVLIDAELPLIQSLNILSRQAKNKYFSRVINEVRDDVEAGSTLNQAMKKHPKVFDDLYCNMIASGEQSGSLDVMLRRLSDFLERIVQIRSQVRQALIYPAAIVTFAILVVIFMMWQVIPVFAQVFTELGASLPGLTVLVLNTSNFVQNNILWIFVGIVALIIGVRLAKNTDTGRRFWDKTKLSMPLFGNLFEKYGLSRVTRTLSTLLSGGVPMLDSLKITSATAGNVIIEEDLMDVRTMVAEGSSLNDALKEGDKFPFMMTQMTGVGEATGTLDEMLTKLADFYDEEVDATVKALLSVLEPILLIGVGGLVGGIVISMYLPIFSLLAQI